MTNHSEIVAMVLNEGLDIRHNTINQQVGNIVSSGMTIIDIVKSGGTLYLFGNGGGAALAQLFASELMSHYSFEDDWPIPAIALSADSAVVTSLANDHGHENLFSLQLRAFIKPKDLAIGISTSGSTPNVVRGIETSKKAGAKAIALTGSAGLIRHLADIEINIPSDKTPRIQEELLSVFHAWCRMLEETGFQRR